METYGICDLKRMRVSHEKGNRNALIAPCVAGVRTLSLR